MSDNPSQRIDVSESFVHPAAYAARLALPIFLIGYRCTGKTTVAQLLAQTLGWNWLDADLVLEKRQGCRIAQIFANSGEAAFRDIEAAVLHELCERNRHVIATGGGVILRAENRQKIKNAGTVVWLTASPDVIWQRLQGDPNTQQTRPNLTTGGLAEIETLLKAREPLYRECAHFMVDTAQSCPEDVAKAILDNLAAKT